MAAAVGAPAPSAVQPSLFQYPPLGLATADMAIASNIAQARYELLRALDFGSAGDLSSWARRWGEGLLVEAEAAISLRERDLPY